MRFRCWSCCSTALSGTKECAARTNLTTFKKTIASPPVLELFKCVAWTLVTSDASADAIGAVWYQIVGGMEQPIAYASRALTPTECNYSATEREAFAAIWACEKWHLYLYGRRFTIQTNYQTLTRLLSVKGVSRRPMRHMRWADRLHQYEFRMVYLPEKSNDVAMFSRHTTAPIGRSKTDPGDTAGLLTIFGII